MNLLGALASLPARRQERNTPAKLQLCAAQFLVPPLLGGAASGGEGGVRWPLQFSFSSCAGSHSFCEPIHSEDTNLFRIMKNSTATKTTFSSLPSLSSVSTPVVCDPVVSNRICSRVQLPAQICTKKVFFNSAPPILTNVGMTTIRDSELSPDRIRLEPVYG